MIPEIKTKWLKDLRSGEYTQARDNLMIEGDKACYCCMGVLGKGQGFKIIVEHNPQHGPDSGRFEDDYYKKGEGFTGMYPTLAKTGLKESEMTLLATMNDQEGKSFLEIADWIETNL